MRVFLVSKVVLTGAFNPQGPAGALRTLCEDASFIYSPSDGCGERNGGWLRDPSTFEEVLT